ncbi:MAG: hypothetical protein IPJ41_06745 [Phycisphaerales bacterium]|nr:hypothetical protein [Phycisphaerales bacterium]
MIPLFGKPWRAYPELDGLSDAECRELVERRWRRQPPRRWIIPAAASAGVLVWAGAVADVIVQSPLMRDPALKPVSVRILLGIVVLACGWGAGAMGAAIARHSLTIATLRKIVAGATCPRCGHSLIGLPITDDATRPEDRSRMRVRCPECGKVVRLLKHGYGPQDLAPWSERVLPKDFKVRLKRVKER